MNMIIDLMYVAWKDDNYGTLEDQKTKLEDNMTNFYKKLADVPKSKLEDTSLLAALKQKDYDFVYKMCLQVFNINKNEKTLSFQIGANANNALQLRINIPVASYVSFVLTSRERAVQSIEQADRLLVQITMQRAEIGAYQNRLESTFAYTEQAGESLQDTESRMRDANMAKETADYLKTKLQNEFQQSFLAQKNASSIDLSVLSFPEK